MHFCASPYVQFFPKGECNKGDECTFAHHPLNSANTGGNSSAGSSRAMDEESPAKAKSRAKAKAKAKGKSTFVAKALLGLARATQIRIGQSMLVFASVATMVEDYRSKEALFCGGKPSAKASMRDPT